MFTQDGGSRDANCKGYHNHSGRPIDCLTWLQVRGKGYIPFKQESEMSRTQAQSQKYSWNGESRGFSALIPKETYKPKIFSPSWQQCKKLSLNLVPLI